MTGVTMIGSGTTFPPSPVVGAVFFRTDTNTGHMWTGSNWVMMAASPTERPWCLFIDDIRHPPDVRLGPEWQSLENDFLIARTCEDAIAMINGRGLPAYITFDHDLGEDQPAATTIMWHIINGHLDEKWDCSIIRDVQIHSANPVGAKNLFLLWEGFVREHGLPSTTTMRPALK